MATHTTFPALISSPIAKALQGTVLQADEIAAKLYTTILNYGMIQPPQKRMQMTSTKEDTLNLLKLTSHNLTGSLK